MILLREVLPGHDAVVDLAAETHVDRSIAGAAEFVTSNVTGVQVLLDACMTVGVSRIVHVSTDRGIRVDRYSGRGPRRSSPGPGLRVLSGQGGRRPARAGLCRTHGVNFVYRPLLQQLRPLPSTRRRSSRCSPRTCSTATPCRCMATGLMSEVRVHVDDHRPRHPARP